MKALTVLLLVSKSLAVFGQTASGGELEWGPPITEEEKVRGSSDRNRESSSSVGSQRINCTTKEEEPGRNRVYEPEVAKRWPEAVIPYQIEAAFTQAEREIVAAGIKNIEDNSCIRFRAKTAADKDWTEIIKTGADGCYVPGLGFKGPNHGKHEVFLQENGCILVGTVVHEFLHLFGVSHEQTRPDRDDYVTVKWTNIEVANAPQYYKGYWYNETATQTFCDNTGVSQGVANFDNCVGRSKMREYGVGYDYESVMHYSASGFAVDSSQPTMVAKDASVTKFGKEELSEKDKMKLKRAYYCNELEKSYCGGNFVSATGGTIKGDPSAGTDECDFSLIGVGQTIIKLDVVATFSGTCDTDYLELRKGGVATGPLIAKYCATNPLPATLQTQTNKLHMKWKRTTSTLTGTWSVVQATCCNELTFSSENDGFKANFLSATLGLWKIYEAQPTYNGFPVFQSQNDKDVCSYKQSATKINFNSCATGIGQSGGYSTGDADICQEYVTGWNYILNGEFVLDPTAKFTCTASASPLPSGSTLPSGSGTTLPSGSGTTLPSGQSTAAQACLPCQEVLTGPNTGNYTLYASGDNRCEDGCIYQKGSKLYCSELSNPDTDAYACNL